MPIPAFTDRVGGSLLSFTLACHMVVCPARLAITRRIDDDDIGMLR